MPTAKVELHLSRRADATWSAVVRPWLERSSGILERAYVIVPTRGQAHAFKQRCLMEGLAFIGVEFLTPGLARQKWLAATDPGADPALGRRVIEREIGDALLATLIERRLVGLKPGDPGWGLWKSIASDRERIWNDFDELLRAGFGAEGFAEGPLRDLMAELVAWIESMDYTLGPLQDRIGARSASAPSHAIGRVLILASGLDSWPDFFAICAFAKRAGEVSAVVTEPAFRSAKTLDERWVELWEAALGTHGVVVDPVDDHAGCSAVGDLWSGAGGSAEQAEVIVGHSRSDEMGLVARRIEGLLASGAENIAVVFSKADVAHVLLARELAQRGVVFADLLESSGSPSIDLQLHRSLVSFYAQGCRLEDLLELWPLLRSLNLVTETAGRLRRVCEKLFDLTQVHGLEACLKRLNEGEGDDWKEVARIVEMLLPAWPEEIAFSDAIARFHNVCLKLQIEPPSEWAGLERFGTRQDAALPRAIVLRALAESLPERVPASPAVGKGKFARVTLTTRRRALGIAWSHVILTESNAGIWPVRQESSGWLADERRREINATSPYSIGVLTSDDRAETDRQAYLHLAGDTRVRLIFSAALGEDSDPELPLSPNAWLERILLNRGLSSQGGIERVFSQLAQQMPRSSVEPKGLSVWRDIWASRRDPAMPFDRFFFSDPAESSRPTRLAARLIEQAVSDPAVLWFNAVLEAQRVEWRPLTRSYSRSLGQFAHLLLAQALEGPPAEDVFREMPKPEVARAKLELSLQDLRRDSPKNRYWDSFLGVLAALTRDLIDQVYTLKSANFVAAEKSLPKHATIDLGPNASIGVRGVMDLVILDRPRWTQATVSIIDFKTGADAKLSARRMGTSGASLQLGVYLAATRSLGIAQGTVWMLKPGAAPAAVTTQELDEALGQLGRIEVHLRTGIYGALTKDRTEFSRGFEWPLACAPIKHAVLKDKFVATFGAGGAAALEEDLYE